MFKKNVLLLENASFQTASTYEYHSELLQYLIVLMFSENYYQTMANTFSYRVYTETSTDVTLNK